ncbi:MAG: HAMP domain-containing histidine kinase [Cyclobacteriaceae bacterium]|nr:HAMP domain-containing histidine kinase [Cyclobacteriaceae bacterium]
MKSKNTLTLILIVSSIALLLALQAFWLISSYEKAYFDLRRETTVVFRSTVMAMRDSLFIKSFEKVPSDTSVRVFNFTPKSDTGTLEKSTNHLQSSSSQIQIYISSDRKGDSVQTLLRPLSARFREGKLNGGNFILRIGVDSLSEDSIRHNFQLALQRMAFDVPFKIIHSSFRPTPTQLSNGGKELFRSQHEEIEKELGSPLLSDSIQSDWVRVDPVHRYAAVLSNFRFLILKEITPQILFSLFLTSLTILAFVVMYKSIRSQQRLMELKNDFISNITHELKTPITTVGVALEALKNFKGLNNPTLTNEYLDIAQNELNRLTILTDKILKTSSFENSGVEYNAEPVELDKIIDQVLASLKLVFEREQTKISFTKEGTDFQLLGSSVHLTSVVYNLLDNALKYSKEIPEIEIQLKATSDQLILMIKDHGMGIASEYRRKVFEKFFRVPTGDVHNIKGYGLGLSYVEGVVKSHKGSIAVESEVGKGSVFTITLPK